MSSQSDDVDEVHEFIAGYYLQVLRENGWCWDCAMLIMEEEPIAEGLMSQCVSAEGDLCGSCYDYLLPRYPFCGNCPFYQGQLRSRPYDPVTS